MSLHAKREISMAAFPSKWLFFNTYMPVVSGVGARIRNPSSNQNYN